MGSKSSKTDEAPIPAIRFRDPATGNAVDYLPPKTSADLKRYLERFCGMKIADKAVCRDHCAPLDAAVAMYFAEHPIIMIEGSRGFSGKSSLLGSVACLEVSAGADVVVLGGSSRQSQRVHEVESEIWKHRVNINGKEYATPFRSLLDEEPTSWYTRTKAGNTLKAITASQKQARGAHPQRLRIDEIDELDVDILDAALGQPMASNGIADQTCLSSTHQYADGTMTEMLRRAKERKWPVYRWCYKECHVNNGGYLTDEDIKRKRLTIGERMWRVEYDLMQPSIEGRILSEATIKTVFGDNRQKTIFDKPSKTYVFEQPEEGAKYATGADWAQSEDLTTIATLRYDCNPVRLVAYEKTNKEDWPVMVARAEERVRRYPGLLVHDGLTFGSVIQGYLNVPAFPFEARGPKRYQLYADYIVGLESGLLRSPKIESLKKEHEYVTHGDLYVAGGHPPDGLCACALAWQGVLGKAHDDVSVRPYKIGRPILWR